MMPTNDPMAAVLPDAGIRVVHPLGWRELLEDRDRLAADNEKLREVMYRMYVAVCEGLGIPYGPMPHVCELSTPNNDGSGLCKHCGRTLLAVERTEGEPVAG